MKRALSAMLCICMLWTSVFSTAYATVGEPRNGHDRIMAVDTSDNLDGKDQYDSNNELAPSWVGWFSVGQSLSFDNVMLNEATEMTLCLRNLGEAEMEVWVDGIGKVATVTNEDEYRFKRIGMKLTLPTGMESLTGTYNVRFNVTKGEFQFSWFSFSIQDSRDGHQKIMAVDTLSGLAGRDQYDPENDLAPSWMGWLNETTTLTYDYITLHEATEMILCLRDVEKGEMEVWIDGIGKVATVTGSDEYSFRRIVMDLTLPNGTKSLTGTYNVRIKVTKGEFQLSWFSFSILDSRDGQSRIMAVDTVSTLYGRDQYDSTSELAPSWVGWLGEGDSLTYDCVTLNEATEMTFCAKYPGFEASKVEFWVDGLDEKPIATFENGIDKSHFVRLAAKLDLPEGMESLTGTYTIRMKALSGETNASWFSFGIEDSRQGHERIMVADMVGSPLDRVIYSDSRISATSIGWNNIPGETFTFDMVTLNNAESITFCVRYTGAFKVRFSVDGIGNIATFEESDGNGSFKLLTRKLGNLPYGMKSLTGTYTVRLVLVEGITSINSGWFAFMNHKRPIPVVTSRAFESEKITELNIGSNTNYSTRLSTGAGLTHGVSFTVPQDGHYTIEIEDDSESYSWGLNNESNILAYLYEEDDASNKIKIDESMGNYTCCFEEDLIAGKRYYIIFADTGINRILNIKKNSDDDSKPVALTSQKSKWIYYVDPNSMLKKIKMDGTLDTPLWDVSDALPYHMTVTADEEWIYYTSTPSYRATTDNQPVLTPLSLYRKNLKTGEAETLQSIYSRNIRVDATNSGDLFIQYPSDIALSPDGEYLYFSGVEGYLKKLSLKDPELSVSCAFYDGVDRKVESYQLFVSPDNEFIYYSSIPKDAWGNDNDINKCYLTTQSLGNEAVKQMIEIDVNSMTIEYDKTIDYPEKIYKSLDGMWLCYKDGNGESQKLYVGHSQEQSELETPWYLTASNPRKNTWRTDLNKYTSQIISKLYNGQAEEPEFLDLQYSECRVYGGENYTYFIQHPLDITYTPEQLPEFNIVPPTEELGESLPVMIEMRDPLEQDIYFSYYIDDKWSGSKTLAAKKETTRHLLEECDISNLAEGEHTLRIHAQNRYFAVEKQITFYVQNSGIVIEDVKYRLSASGIDMEISAQKETIPVSYNYECDGKLGEWQADNCISIDGLIPNNSYNITALVKDRYGRIFRGESKTVTTLPIQIDKIMIEEKSSSGMKVLVLDKNPLNTLYQWKVVRSGSQSALYVTQEGTLSQEPAWISLYGQSDLAEKSFEIKGLEDHTGYYLFGKAKNAENLETQESYQWVKTLPHGVSNIEFAAGSAWIKLNFSCREGEYVEAFMNGQEDALQRGSTDILLTGLTPETAYRVQVRTVNDGGQSAWTEYGIETLPEETHRIFAFSSDRDITVTWVNHPTANRYVMRVYDEQMNEIEALSQQYDPTAGDSCLFVHNVLEGDYQAFTYKVSVYQDEEEIDVYTIRAKIQQQSYSFSLAAQEQKKFMVFSRLLNAFGRYQFEIKYNSSEIEAIDLCAETRKTETEPGAVISNTGIVINQHDIDETTGIGTIVFTLDKTNLVGTWWNGYVNAVVFKNKSGQRVNTNIMCTVNKVQE